MHQNDGGACANGFMARDVAGAAFDDGGFHDLFPIEISR